MTPVSVSKYVMAMPLRFAQHEDLPQPKADTGLPQRPVCDCLDVYEDEILRAIQDKQLQTLEQVREETGAGTGCLSCLGQVGCILRRVLQGNKKSA